MQSLFVSSTPAVDVIEVLGLKALLESPAIEEVGEFAREAVASDSFVFVFFSLIVPLGVAVVHR